MEGGFISTIITAIKRAGFDRRGFPRRDVDPKSFTAFAFSTFSVVWDKEALRRGKKIFERNLNLRGSAVFQMNESGG